MIYEYMCIKLMVGERLLLDQYIFDYFCVKFDSTRDSEKALRNDHIVTSIICSCKKKHNLLDCRVNLFHDARSFSFVSTMIEK